MPAVQADLGLRPFRGTANEIYAQGTADARQRFVEFVGGLVRSIRSVR